MILTGDAISAHEAADLGLVDEVVEPSRLIERSRDLLNVIAANAPVAVRYAIDAVNQSGSVSVDTGLEIERKSFALCATTADKAEGTAAFLAKRKPNFVGS